MALFKIPGFRVKLVKPADAATLQSLLEICADYELLLSGSPPGPEAAGSLLASRPEGKAQQDKLTIGIFTQTQGMVGVLDAVRDYPALADWWLGLLLLDPAYRGQGLGTKIYQAFERWAGELGARCIYLGVLEENQAAYRFWRAAGFELVERQPGRHFGEKEHVVITMKKMLGKKTRG